LARLFCHLVAMVVVACGVDDIYTAVFKSLSATILNA
jgi:hypothetical protein